jgi:hypothetical protein
MIHPSFLHLLHLLHLILFLRRGRRKITKQLVLLSKNCTKRFMRVWRKKALVSNMRHTYSPSDLTLLPVGYDNSINSLTNALHSLETPETQTFLEKCFFKMVSILLDQKYLLPLPSFPHHPSFLSPSKIGGYERGRIEDSLDLSIRILAILLKIDDKFLDLLIKIFSRTPTYYAGPSFPPSASCP